MRALGRIMARMDLRPAALEAATRWARRFWPRPWSLGQLVTRIESAGSKYARAITRWERRTPVWRHQPHQGRKKLSAPALTPEQVDPWDVDEQALATDSRHIKTCPTCQGLKKVNCSRCAGAAKIGCTQCSGSGRVPSKSSNRMVNCRKCRGSGRMKCPACKSGKVPCQPCGAKGKLEAWLEIEATMMSHVGIWPEGAHVSSHPMLHVDSPEADRWEGANLVETCEGKHLLLGEHVGPLARELQWPSIRGAVEPRLDPRLDRLSDQSVRVYQSPVTEVGFSFCGKQGYLQLFGATFEPTEHFDASPFHSYGRWLRGTAVSVAAIVLVATGAFLGRDPFFHKAGGPWLLTMLSAGLGALLFMAAWRRRAGSATPTKGRGLAELGGLGLLGIGVVVAGLLAGLVQPSTSLARQAIEASDLQEARRHLEALDRLHRASEESDALWVLLHHHQARQAESDEQLLSLLPRPGERFGDDPDIVQARHEARMRQFAGSVDRADFETAKARLSELLGEFPEASSQDAAMATLMSAATSLLSEAMPVQAENALLVGWGRFGQRPEYRALAEKVILARAEKLSELAPKVADLRRAKQLEVSQEPDRRLQAVYEGVLAGLAEQAAKGDKDLERLHTLAEAIAGYGALRELFPEHAKAITAKTQEARNAHGQLVARHPVLGATPKVAKTVLWPAQLQGESKGVLRVDQLASLGDARMFLLVEESTVVGAYLAAGNTASGQLQPEQVRAFTEATVGAMPSDKQLQRRGKGVRHLKSKLGGQPMTLGFDGAELVEVWLGQVTP